MNEILEFDVPFNWKPWAVVYFGTVYYAVHGGPNVWVWMKWNSNENYQALLSSDAVYDTLHGDSYFNCFQMKAVCLFVTFSKSAFTQHSYDSYCSL